MLAASSTHLNAALLFAVVIAMRSFFGVFFLAGREGVRGRGQDL